MSSVSAVVASPWFVALKQDTAKKYFVNLLLSPSGSFGQGLSGPSPAVSIAVVPTSGLEDSHFFVPLPLELCFQTQLLCYVSPLRQVLYLISSQV